MSIQSVNSNSYSALQSAIEAAKKRTEPQQIKQAEAKRVPKQSVERGSLFNLLYGTKDEGRKIKNSDAKGTKIDIYA